MTRKQVLVIALMGIVALFITLFYVAMMPIWLPIFVARPSLLNKLSDLVMAKIMQQVAHMMFGSKPNPYAPRIHGR